MKYRYSFTSTNCQTVVATLIKTRELSQETRHKTVLLQKAERSQTTIDKYFCDKRSVIFLRNKRSTISVSVSLRQRLHTRSHLVQMISGTVRHQPRTTRQELVNDLKTAGPPSQRVQLVTHYVVIL